MRADQSIEFLSNLGGVPVLSLPTFKFKPLSFFASWSLEGSPTLPPDDCSRPVCITPPRNVPVVKITESEKNSSPFSVMIDFIVESSITKSTTDPSMMERFGEAQSNSWMAFL